MKKSMKFLCTTVVASLLMMTTGEKSAVAAPTEVQAFTVKISGHGKPMILIPGLASSGEVWDSTVAHYSEHYQCYVLNLAGFAGVAPIKGPLLKQAEEDLSRYIANNHLDHPVVVGHSLGGFLALKLTADHPEQIGASIIVDSLPALGATRNPDATSEQLTQMAAQVRERMEHNDAAAQEASSRAAATSMASHPEDIERIVAWGKVSDRHTVNDSMYDLLSTDLRPELARIKTPTLVLGTWIAYKEYAPRAAIEATFQQQYAKLHNVKIEMADNARHFIMYDDPQWMFAQIDTFLK
ncbi:MAG TPA: alpha/beta hydrolase [Burkholderiaceae bacterium]|jgi:pimeloyl-ACP methyl ester carboxylesterase|nr:alpha/beta hydrolase [Burkholderiaceae bacterium]